MSVATAEVNGTGRMTASPLKRTPTTATEVPHLPGGVEDPPGDDDPSAR